MIAALRWAGLAAALIFTAAVGGFGAALDGYLQWQYPVSLLGARGFPNATAFNLLAFVLPGALAAVVALELRRKLGAGSGWRPRIGAQLVLLSALAFVAMGLMPLDPRDLESEASRLHGTAWMLWSVAFVAGALLLAAGCRRHRGFAWLTLLAALSLLVAGFVLGDAVPVAVAQRGAFAAWFAWIAYAGTWRGGIARG
ncbi:MAG: DUF998 domain-containing protein [Lysobacteraceae bacterium]|nr:MAG: DUF998 domain-containing protein [Xanthomonadaceae bacterium]